MKLGDNNEDVKKLHNFLKQFGYMLFFIQNSYQNETFNEDTEYAIRLFQRRYKLPITGALDDKTVEVMSLPRCGQPDTYWFGESIMYNVHGPKWNKLNLNYSIASFPDGFSQTDIENVIADALEKWQSLKFKFCRV